MDKLVKSRCLPPAVGSDAARVANIAIPGVVTLGNDRVFDLPECAAR